jgi:hypothetical protein
MTRQAQGSKIVEVALTTAFSNRQNMVGVPQGFAIQADEAPAVE